MHTTIFVEYIFNLNTRAVAGIASDDRQEPDERTQSVATQV